MGFVQAYAFWLVSLLSLVVFALFFWLIYSQYRAARIVTWGEGILEAQTDLICCWNPDGIITWVNPAYCEFFQQTPEQLIGKNGFDLVPEYRHPEARLRLAELSPERPDRASEFEIVRPDGSKGWHEWISRAIFDPRGKLVGYLSVARDITDRKQAEIALKKSEGRYRSVITDTNDWVWEMDLDLNVLFSNYHLDSILGYERGELQDRAIDTLMHSEDLANLRERMPAYVAQGAEWKALLLRYRHKDGSYRFLSSSATPVFSSHGQVIGFRGIDRDVTFRALAFQGTSQLLGSELNADVLEAELGEWAKFFSVQAIEMWWLDKETGIALMAHGWSSPTCPPRLEEYSFSELTWFRETLLSGNVVRICHPDDYPPAAAIEKDLSAQQGITATLVVPFTIKGMEGHLGIGSLTLHGETREWTDRDIEECRIVFNLFATFDARMRNEEALRQRESFQSMLSGVSSSLLTAPRDAVEPLIEDCLQGVAAHHNLDRVALWYFGEDRKTVRCRHKWSREGMEAPLTDFVVLDIIPWISQQVLDGQTVRLNTVDDIPERYPIDREFLSIQGVKSELAIPIFVDDQHVGVGVFNTIRYARQWSDQDVYELQLLAEVIMNRFVRHEANKVVQRTVRDLSRSQALAHVGSYAYYPDEGSASFPAAGRMVSSDQLRALLGCTTEEVSVALFISRLHPEDRTRVLESAQRLFNEGPEGEGATARYRIVQPSGKVVFVEDRAEVTRETGTGNLVLFCSVKDISEQVERESKLKEALDAVSRLEEQLREENVYLREEIKLVHDHRNLVGDSPQFRQALSNAEKVARTDVSVLLLGETGTGKELIARAIHEMSDRAEKSMVSVNCAALSETLIESELFGHERGAFTGAVKQRKGRFELADKGTLFLDEIGELPLGLQAKLLRVLQTGVFERVGGGEAIEVDVRVIAATNRDLQRGVQRGEFRDDLFYRINNFPIQLPPLRERTGDIPLLAQHFVHRYAAKVGREVTSISPRMMRHLLARDWPGNARELENFIEYALISGSGPVLDYLPPDAIVEETAGSTSSGLAVTSLEDAERNHIEHILERVAGRVAGKGGAAELLGVPPSTLRSKMKRLGITQPQDKGAA